MPWPTVAVITTGMDADTDTLPRTDILDHTQKFNQLIAMRGVADGVCDLDASARVPNAKLDPALAAYAGTLTAANKIPYATALDTAGELTRDIDGTLTANSDLNLPTQKAVKTYVDSKPKITAGTAVATTAGALFDFPVPLATAKRITVMFSGVSTNGASPFLFQLGTSAGIEITGYEGVGGNYVAVTTSAAGFPSHNHASTVTDDGFIVFSLIGSNIWTCSGSFASVGNAQVVSISGSKTLAAALTQIRVTTINGTDAFTAGTVNILYE